MSPAVARHAEDGHGRFKANPRLRVKRGRRLGESSGAKAARRTTSGTRARARRLDDAKLAKAVTWAQTGLSQLLRNKSGPIGQIPGQNCPTPGQIRSKLPKLWSKPAMFGLNRAKVGRVEQAEDDVPSKGGPTKLKLTWKTQEPLSRLASHRMIVELSSNCRRMRRIITELSQS